MTTLSPETMTAAEAAALMVQLRKVVKDAREQENARYSELAREMIETVLSEHPVEASEYSERVGHSTQNLTIEVEGRTYTFYVSIKDVQASEERKAAIEAGTVTLKKRKPKKAKSEDASEETPEGDTDTDTEADTEEA